MILAAEFERRMKEIAEMKDIEDRHIKADNLLCEVLESMGYSAGTKIFREMRRGYV